MSNYEKRAKLTETIFVQLRVEEGDVSRCGEMSNSVRRVFVEKNFQMDTQLRECEIVHTEIEQMIFNVNMKLNVSSTNYNHSVIDLERLVQKGLRFTLVIN